MSDRDINIRVKVRDDGSVVLETIGDKGEKSFARIRTESGKAEAATRKFADSTSEAVDALKSLAAAVGVGFVARDIVQAGIAMERMTTALVAATGSSELAAAEFGFVSDEADRLGLNLETAAGAFSKIAASAKNTKLEGQGTRDIFTAVAEASTVLGLSADDTEGALRALEQMLGKGTVQAEELRGQLGERIPGAFQIAARAMGVTTVELNKMLDMGEVLSEDFLPKFARELRNTFSGQLPEALDNAQVQFNRFATELFRLKADFAAAGFLDGLLEVVGGLSELLKDQEFRAGLNDLSKHVGLFIADLKDLPRDALDFIDSYGTSIKAVGGFLVTVTAAQLAFNVAVRANPYVLGASALVWVAGWFKDYTDRVIKATEATRRLNEEFGAITGKAPAARFDLMQPAHGGAAGSPEFQAALAAENLGAIDMLPSHGTPALPGQSTAPRGSGGLTAAQIKKNAEENKKLLESMFDMDAWYGDQSDASEAWFQEEKKRIDELWRLREERAQQANEEFIMLGEAAQEAEKSLLEVTRAALPEQERAVYDVQQAYAALNEQVNQLAEAGEISKELADSLHNDLAVRMQDDLDDLAAKTEDTFGRDMKNAVTGWASSFSSTLNDLLWESDATFGDIARSFGKMLTQMYIQKQLVEPLLSGGGNLISTGIDFASSLFGFATGGSFTVGGSGGTDSQLVAFRATPGENVTVTTPGQQAGGGGVVFQNTFQIIMPSGAANSEAASSERMAAEASRMLQNQMRAWLLDEKRPGGILNRQGVG
ncbi:MAG: tape measure protein [Thermodesulfobacteriota bacterium]